MQIIIIVYQKQVNTTFTIGWFTYIHIHYKVKMVRKAFKAATFLFYAYTYLDKYIIYDYTLKWP